ncbi:AGAP012093-PA [Anopheles gambiae str. PEST]|uniref:AGAP012093-PA n=1 Tax=Anopheles gambiae TaxID=7165 RepID=Q7PZU5_ANOGA|nr:AGAP012093-PA [Anopheles gambiae str. PEST]
MTKFMLARRCLEVATDTLGTAANTLAPRLSAAGPFGWMKHRKSATQGFDDGDRPPVDPEAVHADLLRRLTKLYEQEVARELIVPPFKRALLYGEKAAVHDQVGDFTFIQLYEAVKRLAAQISKCCGKFG